MRSQHTRLLCCPTSSSPKHNVLFRPLQFTSRRSDDDFSSSLSVSKEQIYQVNATSSIPSTVQVHMKGARKRFHDTHDDDNVMVQSANGGRRTEDEVFFRGRASPMILEDLYIAATSYRFSVVRAQSCFPTCAFRLATAHVITSPPPAANSSRVFLGSAFPSIALCPARGENNMPHLHRVFDAKNGVVLMVNFGMTARCTCQVMQR